MPYIDITTNRPIPKETETALKKTLGQAIEIIPRKSENWLMCAFHGDENICFRGDYESAAYVEVKLFGTITNETSALFTAQITKILGMELEIPPDRIYVSYFTTPNWGWSGKNF